MRQGRPASAARAEEGRGLWSPEVADWDAKVGATASCWCWCWCWCSWASLALRFRVQRRWLRGKGRGGAGCRLAVGGCRQNGRCARRTRTRPNADANDASRSQLLVDRLGGRRLRSAAADRSEAGEPVPQLPGGSALAATTTTTTTSQRRPTSAASTGAQTLGEPIRRRQAQDQRGLGLRLALPAAPRSLDAFRQSSRAARSATDQRLTLLPDDAVAYTPERSENQRCKRGRGVLGTPARAGGF